MINKESRQGERKHNDGKNYQHSYLYTCLGEFCCGLFDGSGVNQDDVSNHYMVKFKQRAARKSDFPFTDFEHIRDHHPDTNGTFLG
jgi:hypothetical protein